MAKRDYFAGKRIAVIGLGPNAEMVPDIRYLIRSGALVGLYDLRSEAKLKSHLVFLRSIGLANYVCGSIPEDDLLDMDMIILSHEYPRESSFLKKISEKKNITVEYPETLFFKLSPPVTLIGIIGTCGKSTVSSILTPMLENACAPSDDQNFISIDLENGTGMLSHLKKMKNGDIVLMKIEEMMLRELTTMRISPQVAIYTTLPDKIYYDKTPFDILEYQTYNNFIVAKDEIIDAIRSYGFQPKVKMLRTKSSIIPVEWSFASKNEHDRENASLALQVARLFKISEDAAQTIMSKWKTLKGRLEFVKKVKNSEFYNDSYSISPLSTISGLKALSDDKNIILIFGGADRGFDYSDFFNKITPFVRLIITLPGSGTIKERKRMSSIQDMEILSSPSLEEAVRLASEKAEKGDKIIFSPAFEAGGYDRSRKERSERFVRAVRSL